LDTAAERVFLTATDLPFGTLALAEALLERLGRADACIIRRGDGQLEPAFGVYRRTCLGPLQDCLQEGRRSFRALLSRVTVQWVSEADLGEFPLERLLQNINTPEAYAENVVG
jgi:molybdopterin-guanine dinucleotide biosynthesis protein A